MWPTSVVSVFEFFSLVNVGNLLAGWLKPSLKTLYPFHAKEFVYWCHQLFCKNDLGKRLNSLECSFWELRSVWVGSIPQEQHPLEQHPPNDFHWSNFATSSLHVVKAFWVKLTNVWGMHRSLSDCMVMIYLWMCGSAWHVHSAFITLGELVAKSLQWLLLQQMSLHLMSLQHMLLQWLLLQCKDTHENTCKMEFRLEVV